MTRRIQPLWKSGVVAWESGWLLTTQRYMAHSCTWDWSTRIKDIKDMKEKKKRRTIPSINPLQ